MAGRTTFLPNLKQTEMGRCNAHMSRMDQDGGGIATCLRCFNVEKLNG